MALKVPLQDNDQIVDNGRDGVNSLMVGLKRLLKGQGLKQERVGDKLRNILGS